MQSFDNILAVVDPDRAEQEALRRACRVAQRNNARLSALAVLSDVPGVLGEWAGKRDKEWIEHEKDEVRREIERIVGSIAGDQHVSRTTARLGESAIETIREVIRGGHDLVVKDRDQTPAGAGISGRDMRLLRKCPCPVWLVAPPPPGGLGRVLAAVDLKTEKEADQLNRKVIGLAQSLLGYDKGELHVVHAWNEIGLIYWGRRMPVDEFDRYVDGLRERHRQLLLEFLKSADVALPDAQVHLVENEPGAAIPALARDLGVSTIVMGTVARTGLSGFFMGNTAEQVLRQIDCSVLAIKPDGFESPVKPE